MADRRVLEIGSSIALSDGGRLAGRIGGFAKSGSRLYALTARHVVGRDRDASIVALSTRATIGVVMPNDFNSKLETHPACEAIAAVELAQEAAINAVDASVLLPTSANALRPTGLVSIKGLCPVEALWNERVRVLGGADFLIEGHVVGFGRPLLAGASPGPLIRYRDVIELRFDGDLVAPPGSGGALVIDSRDRALGLLFAANADRAYVAPLQPFLDEADLDFLCEGTVVPQEETFVANAAKFYAGYVTTFGGKDPQSAVQDFGDPPVTEEGSR